MSELCSRTNALPDAEMIQKEVLEMLSEAKVLALRFYRLTGKPLGITGEVAEYEAATNLASYYILQKGRCAGAAISPVTRRILGSR